MASVLIRPPVVLAQAAQYERRTNASVRTRAVRRARNKILLLDAQ
jgi:hypothetical protein